jgi:hypothetical protein
MPWTSCVLIAAEIKANKQQTNQTKNNMDDIKTNNAILRFYFSLFIYLIQADDFMRLNRFSKFLEIRNHLKQTTALYLFSIVTIGS